MTALDRALAQACAFLDTLQTRGVHASCTPDDLRRALGGPLPESGADPADVVEALAAGATPGLVASAGPRYFGFVSGGSLPAALAADWLASAWDQNAALAVMSPAAAIIEEIAAAWMLDALRLPRDASVGFTTGAHTANVTALAAARHEVLRRAGWDVEARGLQGGPIVTVIAGQEAHSSIAAACRLVGLGAHTIVRVPSDDQGRMRADALAEALRATSGPRIVCAQAGNVNTGASDPFPAIVAEAHAHGAWVHVDGAFGLWARAAPGRAHLVGGVDAADSWTTDAHKWLNVPYDSGVLIVRHPAPRRAAMSQTAAYLIASDGEIRDGMDWVPEASRRARGVPIYAALRQLGRGGLADLVERCSALAARCARALAPEPGAIVLNEVVLNQVLVRFEAGGVNVTPSVIEAVQRDGVCWAGGTAWQGGSAMRISVSNWSTTEADIDASVDSILRAFRSVVAAARAD